MSKLATIEIIKEVIKHPNADVLDIVSVLGYKAIVKKDTYKVNDKIIFIQPDTVLPDAEWSAFYKAKSNRVKAIKLRKVWSEGIVENLTLLPVGCSLEEGVEVSSELGIKKYEPPLPKEINAKGNLPFGIFKTDEERFNNLDNLPYGEEVIVTLKIDGQSGSYYVKQLYEDKSYESGVTSRSLDLKLDATNNYTLINNKYNILEKLKAYCISNSKNLCIRGECYGQGIQSFAHNPHTKLPLDFAAFSLLNLDNLKYESFDSCIELCKQLDIPVVPIIERTILTPELIQKYSEGIDKIDGKPFEGVVVKCKEFSFKIINKSYDASK